MIEIPPQEVLRSQITAINSSLHTLAEKATSQFELFNESNVPEEPLDGVAITKIQDSANSAGFWNHYIGGAIASASQDMERAEFRGESIDENLLRVLQARTIRNTRIRLSSLVDGNVGDLLDRASCEAYLKASGAFDWSNIEARDEGLFRTLQEAVSKLGDNYIMLLGRRPL